MTKEDIQEVVRRLEAAGFSVEEKEYVYNNFTVVGMSVSGDLTAELYLYSNDSKVWVHVCGDDTGYGIRPTSVDDVITKLRDTLLRDAAVCERRADRLRAHAGRLV